VHAGEPRSGVSIGHDVDTALTAIDRALPVVYDYLLHRVGVRALAEDLTSDTILAAVDQVRRGQLGEISIGYLIGIARHKLVDHWRRQDRERRHLRVYAGGADRFATDVTFEPSRTTEVLAALNPMQRAALTLRYVDDLSVPEVARVLSRSVHATETLLIRAKRAFRAHYADLEDQP
jgi:RNA polymerase sigma-70 factor (ECF subfamily)